MMYVLLSVALLSGCGGSYEQKPLGLTGPHADQVNAVLQELRDPQAPMPIANFIQQYGADQLTKPQIAALDATLQRIVSAKQVELVSLDRFGRQVYRAGIRCATPPKTDTFYVLLVEIDDQLRWAGPN